MIGRRSTGEQSTGHQSRPGATRRVVLATAAAMVLAGAAGASAQGSGLGAAGAPVEVRMIANEAFARQWQTNMVPEFNKKFPNVKVTIDGVPYAELLAKSLLDLTGSSPRYDIIIADDPWTPQLAQTGHLLDLKKGAAAWTDKDFDWDDFNAAPLAASEWRGVQYGVPLRSNMLLMFVNKTLYKKAGLPEPTPALTWAQYLEQAPKLVQDTSGAGKPTAWAIDTYFTRDALTPTIWQTIMQSNGGALIGKDGKSAFASPVGVKALQTHIDLMKFAPPGAGSHGFNESLQAFRQGQTATMFMWGSVFKGTAVDAATTTLTPEQVGIQVMPVGSAGPGAHRGIWSGVVSAKSANPRAAWALLQWLSSKEGEQWHANALGVFPARKSTLASEPSSPWMKPVYVALQQAYEASAKLEMWRPRHPRSDAIQQALADETARAMSGQASAEEALKSAAARIDRILR